LELKDKQIVAVFYCAVAYIAHTLVTVMLKKSFKN